MKQKPRPAIALLVEASRAYGRDLLRGVALFARTNTNWSLFHQEMSVRPNAETVGYRAAELLQERIAGKSSAHRSRIHPAENS